MATSDERIRMANRDECGSSNLSRTLSINSEAGAADVDWILHQLRPAGLWQISSFVTWNVSMMVPWSFSVLAVVFVGLSPPHHCAVPDNTSLPQESRGGRLMTSQCLMHDPSNQSRLVGCQDGWTYTDDRGYGNTIVTEWDLVCSRNYHVELSQMINTLGSVAGFFLMSVLSDRFGRRPVHYIGVGTAALSLLITGFSSHLGIFYVLRFLSGFAVSGTAAGFTASVEMFPSRYRGNAGILCQCAWMFSMLLHTLIAYYVRDWQLLFIVFGCVVLVMMPTYFYVSESIPWLLKNGRLKEAAAVIARAASINRIDAPPTLEEHRDIGASAEVHPGREEASDSVRNCLILFRSTILRKHVLIMNLIWFSCSFVWYGISYTAATWSGNRFLNFFYNALSEAPAIVLVLLLLQRIERRTIICGCFVTGGVVLLVATFLPDTDSLHGVKIFLILLGKVLACSSFNTAWLYTPELFPTFIRNTGVGVSITGSLIGGLITTFSPVMGRLYPKVPGLSFGIIPLVIAPLALLLPGTKDRPLAQSLREMEHWQHSPTCRNADPADCRRNADPADCRRDTDPADFCRDKDPADCCRDTDPVDDAFKEAKDSKTRNAGRCDQPIELIANLNYNGTKPE